MAAAHGGDEARNGGAKDATVMVKVTPSGSCTATAGEARLLVAC